MNSSETPRSSENYIYEISALKYGKKNNTYFASLDIDPKLFGVIIGKKGSVIKSIQSSTQTTIIIPRDNSSTVTVQGPSCENIHNAWTEILSQLNSIKTHFLSIPIGDENFHKVFISFKERFLQTCKEESRIKERAFRRPHKLHLTLVTMRLSDDNEIKNCIEKINQFKQNNEHLFKNFKINFKGVEFWEEDHSAVSCLFTKPVDNSNFDNLMNFGVLLKQFLIKEKVIPESNDDNMNFHLLLMNKRYLLEDFPDIKNFDFTGLMEEFANFNFGGFEATKICLSRKLTGDDVNYYTNDAVWFFEEDIDLIKMQKLSLLDS